MIAKDDGGSEPVLEHFTLNPIDFALPQQVVRNFTPLRYLTPLLLDFVLLHSSSMKLVDITK